MMNRKNMTWNDSITDEEIMNRHFSIGYLLQSNSDIPFFDDLKEKILSTYMVTARFYFLGYNGSSLNCNGQILAYRPKKTSPVKFGKDVTLIEGLPLSKSGSNKYPTVRFKGNHCVLRFISYGLPFVKKLNGWSIRVIEIKKLS